MDQKICPILGAGPVEINTNCKQERCSWYRNGGCILAEVADGLAEIAKNLKEIDVDLTNLDIE